MNKIIERLHIRYLINRIRERLWVKPLFFCLLSVMAALGAKFADDTKLNRVVPAIKEESIETLLSVMAGSMLVIATFAVGSMVSAYASASSNGTPRAFKLMIADDVSQNALSTFIGAFIFSIVALTAVKNNYFGVAGRFTLFVLTGFVFGTVLFTFVHWVDQIARLGRLGTTIDRVEKATAEALARRAKRPLLGGVAVQRNETGGEPVFAAEVGYVQRVDLAALQAWAEKANGRVVISALPGAFAAPGRALAYAKSGHDVFGEDDIKQVADAFLIGADRLFDDDPRFGLVVLSEIAGRALSPAVNDPGTAISIVGTLVRLFTLWNDTAPEEESSPEYDRVEVPRIAIGDMFDDAFVAIARDGAGVIEVALRLQKALRALASIDDAEMRNAAMHHSHQALARAEAALDLPDDLMKVRDAARFSESSGA